MARESIASSGSGGDAAGETGRERRGRELFENGYFERISRDRFLVINPERGAAHEIDLEDGTCSHCGDYEHHRHIQGFRCYHLVGAKLYAEWLRGAARDLSGYFGSVA